MKSPRCSTNPIRSASEARSSSKIIRRYAFCAPSFAFWQLTKTKRTGLGSSTSGAVIVRPTRLPNPSESVKRYQYTRLGLSPPTSTRQVQSDAAEIGALAVATTRVNISSSETSTFNFGADPFSAAGGRRVHKRTLLLSGSPEATPSGKRSRRSCHAIRDFAPNALPQAAVAPMAAAISRKERRVMEDIGFHSLRTEAIAPKANTQKG